MLFFTETHFSVDEFRNESNLSMITLIQTTVLTFYDLQEKCEKVYDKQQIGNSLSSF